MLERIIYLSVVVRMRWWNNAAVRTAMRKKSHTHAEKRAIHAVEPTPKKTP
jgi:hypothetical protein